MNSAVGFVVAYLFGGLFALLGWGSMNYRRHKFSTGTVTSGVIVGEQVRSITGDLYGMPVVEFTDHTGARRSFVHPAGTNLPAPTPGRRVPVWYDPDDPDKAPEIHRELVASAMPYLFLVVGVLTVLATTGFLVLTVRG